MHILLAEDSKSIAMPIIAFLEQGGHEVTHVLDGRAAVAAFAARPPDMVLMDVVMPVLDGIEATRQIKALSGARWIPLMLMTVLSGRNEIVAGFVAGADDYLIKPIILEVLQARINSLQRIATMQASLRGILDNVYEGILTINSQGHVQSYNLAAEKIFGYKPEEVIGKNVSMLMPEPDASRHDHYLQRYEREGDARIIGIGRKARGLRKNGQTFPMRLAVTEVKRPAGNLYIGLISDISSEEAARERIEFLALHDALTGLPNRVQFNARLDHLCNNPSQDRHAVLFLDLDGFKAINDQHGHEIGDQALCVAAQRLRRELPQQDFVARLGGDEFAAICHQIPSPATAEAVAQRLLACIAEPMLLSGIACRMGVSIGIAFTSNSGAVASDILTAADHAMYAAKRRGKNQVVLATQSF